MFGAKKRVSHALPLANQRVANVFVANQVHAGGYDLPLFPALTNRLSKHGTGEHVGKENEG